MVFYRPRVRGLEFRGPGLGRSRLNWVRVNYVADLGLGD